MPNGGQTQLTPRFNWALLFAFLLTVLGALGSVFLVIVGPRTGQANELTSDAKALLDVFSHAFTLGIGGVVGAITGKAAS